MYLADLTQSSHFFCLLINTVTNFLDRSHMTLHPSLRARGVRPRWVSSASQDFPIKSIGSSVWSENFHRLAEDLKNPSESNGGLLLRDDETLLRNFQAFRKSKATLELSNHVKVCVCVCVGGLLLPLPLHPWLALCLTSSTSFSKNRILCLRRT